MRKREFYVFGLISFLAIIVLLFIGLNLTGLAIVNLSVGSGGGYVDGHIRDDFGILTNESNLNHLAVGDDFAKIFRSFIDFDTSSIPDGATINGVNLSLTLDFVSGTLQNINVYVLNASADSLVGVDNEGLYAQCEGVGSNQTVSNSGVLIGKSVGENIIIELDSIAQNILKANLGSNIFSVCIQSIDESLSGNLFYFNSSESANEGARPLLIVDYTSSDTTPPQVTIINPLNTSFGIDNVSSGIEFNVSLDETGAVNYTLDGGANNVSMVSADNLNFGGVNNSIDEGSYTVLFYAFDDSGNVNDTESVTFNIDLTIPGVNITSPQNITYTSNSYSVSVNTSENSVCKYSVNGGATNTSLTSSDGGMLHTGSVSSVANAQYTLNAYCDDIAGNSNETESVIFVINYDSGGGGGGGGGGGCDKNDWTCEDWSDCVDGFQSRICVNDCATENNETQTCNVTEEDNRTVCTNQCVEEGNYCDGNAVVTCKIIEGCYRIVNIEDCGSKEECVAGICIYEGDEGNEILGGLSRVWKGRGQGFFLEEIPKPSDFIPHGNIPDVVVDAGIGMIFVGTASWLGWLWLLALLPFFLRRLKHYSISIFDSNDELKLFGKRGKLNKEKLLELLNDLNKNYGQLVPVNKEQDIRRYLVEDGFIEIRIDEPFILTGHFTNRAKAEEFESSLKNVLMRAEAKIDILNSVEIASIIRIFRAWLRERKAKKIMERFKKK